jgi:propionyl-CoA carboxylase beta chain
MQKYHVGFARLGGRSIGIVANQPLFIAGVWMSTVRKAAPLPFFYCFNIPLLVLVVYPDFYGTDQNGTECARTKLLYALSEATVPRITVIT